MQSNWRSKMSYVSTAISIAMVIYVLGLMGYLLLKAQTLSDKSKESFRFEIYLREGVKEVEIMQFKKMLDAEDFVKKTVFKDKDEALQEFHRDVNPNENFMMILGENPLPQNIDVYFTANYTHPDSAKLFQKSITSNPLVSDFRFPSDLLYTVHENVKFISLGLLLVGGLLLTIAIALINNTIRLRVYSQRFLIRTMQLIGASKSYIRRPFLWNGVVLGFVSGCIGVISLVGSLHLLYNYWPEVADQLISFQQDIQLYLAMVGLAVIISLGSSLFAVSRFLRLKTEQLYY
jgi:cell division transport system permease protein